MMEVLFFNAAQLCASGYAFARGGSPERIVAGLLLAASLATLSIPADAQSFHSVFWPIVWIDVVLLVALCGVTIFADRFWPAWIASCQLVTVASHGVRAYDPGLIAMAYWLIIESIAYPMLAMLVIGVWRHQRRLPSGTEFSWTSQRHRHERRTAEAAILS